MDDKPSISEGLRELALFAGAGGGILGGRLLGWRTVCAVEREQYPAAVLAARQNDGTLEAFPIWSDVCTFDGRPWRGLVDVVSGGFPCQDVSVAGKGAGLEGERSGLWREFARIIREVQPPYAFIENSPMLVTRGLNVVLQDLAQMGYDASWGVVSASDVGAPHQRKRIWIYATHSSHQRCDEWGSDWEERYVLHNSNWDATQGKSERNGRKHRTGAVGADVVNSVRNRPQGGGQNGSTARQVGLCSGAGSDEEQSVLASTDQWAVKPSICKVVDGMADRVDRLKAAGNGQVPLCAAVAWATLRNLHHKV
jgi:DNA (cytosine-5)-methyltransferase 1